MKKLNKKLFVILSILILIAITSTIATIILTKEKNEAKNENIITVSQNESCKTNTNYNTDYGFVHPTATILVEY